MQTKLNGIQKFGLILLLLGVIFILFPVFIGATALMFVAGIVIAIGVFFLIQTYRLGSIFLSILSVFLILVGVMIFFNPGIILFVIGMMCIISGLGDMFYIFSRPNKDYPKILYPIVLILLGGYAAFNTTGAVTTIGILFGTILVVFGGMLALRGKEFGPTNQTFYYKFTRKKDDSNPNPYDNVYTYKKSDEDKVIDVEYEEVKEDD